MRESVHAIPPGRPRRAAPRGKATASDATPFSSAATDTIYAPDSTTDYQPDATTEPQRDGAPSPTPAESIEYASPHTEQSLWELHPRGTFAFTFIAFLMLIANGAVAYLAWFAQQHHELSEHVLLLASMGGAAAFLLFAAIALILWLVWVYGIHKDLRVLSGGRHTISPGQAVGFSFLPLFDAFWAVYMPVRACGALNQHLAARGLRKASKGTVITCQLFSILFALAIPGLTPFSTPCPCAPSKKA